MAKKRGGAAGLWDRNKKWLRSVVPAALGAIPGVGVPLAIGAGAAMRGFDREGQRGIGFDVKQGVRGGLEGYGMGKLGEGARVGLTKMLAPKLPSVAAPSKIEMTNTMLRPRATAAQAATQAAAPASAAAPVAAAGAAAPTVGGPPPAPGRLTRTMDFLTKYEKPLGQLTSGVMSQLPTPDTQVDQSRLALDERKFEEELRRQRMIEQRQALMAQLLMPILQSRLNQRNAAGGASARGVGDQMMG